MRSHIVFLWICIVACVLCYSLYGEVDINEIVIKADAKLENTTAYSVSEMTVYKAGKAQPAMKVEGYSLYEDEKTYSLTVYRAPAKMKGTAYLMIDDDIWVKFGNTGRIRKLSSSAKKNSAGGTDFSYSDLSDNDTGLSKQYTITLQAEKVAVEGIDCYKVEFARKSGADTPYEILTAYITHDDEKYIKIEYEEQGAIIKTLSLLDWKEVDGRNYPHLIRMESHTKDSYTEYKVIAIEFDSSRVKKSLFTQTYLEQIK